MKINRPPQLLFADRAAALDAAVLGYLTTNSPASDMAVLHLAFRPGFTRAEVNRAIDRLGRANRIGFLPSSSRVLVAPISEPITHKLPRAGGAS